MRLIYWTLIVVLLVMVAGCAAPAEEKVIKGFIVGFSAPDEGDGYLNFSDGRVALINQMATHDFYIGHEVYVVLQGKTVERITRTDLAPPPNVGGVQ